MPTTSARRIALVAGLLVACNSDFPIYDSQSTGAASTSTSTGPAPTSTGGDSTTSDDTTSTSSSLSESSSGGDETTAAPPEQTCRDVLMCVGTCALNFSVECFQMCTGGVSPEEGQKALALGACIVGGCFADGKCTTENLMDVACLGCLAVGLLGGKPEGCEDEAAACE